MQPEFIEFRNEGENMPQLTDRQKQLRAKLIERRVGLKPVTRCGCCVVIAFVLIELLVLAGFILISVASGIDTSNIYTRDDYIAANNSVYEVCGNKSCYSGNYTCDVIEKFIMQLGAESICGDFALPCRYTCTDRMQSFIWISNHMSSHNPGSYWNDIADELRIIGAVFIPCGFIGIGCMFIRHNERISDTMQTNNFNFHLWNYKSSDWSHAVDGIEYV